MKFTHRQADEDDTFDRNLTRRLTLEFDTRASFQIDEESRPSLQLIDGTVGDGNYDAGLWLHGIDQLLM